MTKEEILEQVPIDELYRRYLPNWIPNKLASAPFREDKEPSLSVFEYQGKLLWKDHGSDHKGDIFTLVALINNLDVKSDFAEVLATIKRDMALWSPLELDTKKGTNLPISSLNVDQTSIVATDWTKEALKFWTSFGIPENVLNRYGVTQISSYTTKKGHTFPIKKPSYAFAYEVNARYKIYIPKQDSATEKRFFKNQIKTDYFGYKQLPSEGKSVVITGGEKDCLVFNAMGFSCITMQSENQNPPKSLLEELKDRFLNIYICYDNDKAGIGAVNRILEFDTDLTSFKIPNEYKDIAEMSSHLGLESAKDLVVEAIQGKVAKQDQVLSEEDKIYQQASKKYVRVGLNYYKIQHRPTINGELQEILTKWSRPVIIQDHGVKVLNFVAKYEGFVTLPEHFNLKKEYSGFYNKYMPLPFEPDDTAKNIDLSISFLQHIFKNCHDWEMGLDYLTLLYRMPTQKLPILSLVSKDRHTGKSTFCEWLNAIFGSNMTMSTNQDLESNFNTDMAGKLIVAIDEAYIGNKSTIERIKYLSTTHRAKIEGKGEDKYEMDNFTKWVLCSNNEDSFIQTDKDEVRFWVLKVDPLMRAVPDIIAKLKKEIPALLHYLKDRPIKYPNETRAWFNFQLLQTDALLKLQENSVSSIEKEIRELIKESILEFKLPHVQFTLADLTDALGEVGSLRFHKTDVSRLLKNEWNLRPEQGRYKKYRWGPADSAGNQAVKVSGGNGRHYTFKAERFLNDEEFAELNQTNMFKDE